MFGKTPDPDFVEASLLEQYQAQIGSALTPAFAADSSPELASEAINVSATFIATGIVTNVERMGRILKLLVLGLENFSSKSIPTTSLRSIQTNTSRKPGYHRDWRPQGTQLERKSHGQDGPVLSLGPTADCEHGTRILDPSCTASPRDAYSVMALVASGICALEIRAGYFGKSGDWAVDWQFG